MYTKIKHNSSFFLAVFILLLASCSMNDQYITNVKDVLDKADYVTPASKKVPFCVGKYYDDTGEKICKNIPDIFFVRAAPQFNPGFYKGVLWLDVYFPDTQPKLGSEYMIDFGSEPIDFAELFIQYGNEWKMYGRTGRMLKRRQMTNPSWRLSIPLNECCLCRYY